MQNWKKLGLIFKANNNTSDIYSYTAMPQVLQLDSDLYRIYFGSRNKNNEPSVNYFEININNPKKILEISKKSLLLKGEWGMFDDNGLYPGNVVKNGDALLMYYMGRSNGVRPLFYMAIGVAESFDNGLSFNKKYKTPILDRNKYDPWMTTTPFVMKEDIWHMWYTSGIGWNMDKDDPKSYYQIKYAKSDDGLKWETSENICIRLSGNESNIASPTLIKEKGIYKMWYSYVSEASYQIGYAESIDRENWVRKDAECGIELSKSGFDSSCMAYPCVFRHNGKKYMLYSANILGKEGIGLLVNE